MQDNSKFGKTKYFHRALGLDRKTEGTLPFRYYNSIRNCGDAITSYILQDTFGITGRVAPPKEEHLIGIGSIFFMANKNSYVWGSGVLSPQAAIPNIDPKKISALRGTKTVSHLRSLGYEIPDVPLGDPGIFVNTLGHLDF